ncbi:hypothetical protein G7B40_008700 [Aetokthonos hydrillicola Thurmond2011]|jgi:hypothetical protein|uniref:Uncharacterized protein n=1 Tax=Aetokthonos hydrillicola Thurmond2011 TaxID=2712845 RepID=A0AAP5M8E6_9CYAN|nr:hypothetical protein [Aetokthonos hydrillicola]MBO3457669.1 hypothetical protein [Aetokthonos hydrillicola CCALA 1050]MBW4587948.1 hypothetical protein [Aetokthonos hydrillicola CCALA 1050]MDR9894647.1 hypothetical protein [Aetokthonos hydrillicola Thurmond2011]
MKPEQMWTVSEWCADQGYELTHSEIVRLSTIASLMYKKLYGVLPQKVSHKSKTTGRFNTKAYGYPDSSLLESAWEEFLNTMTFDCPGGVCSVPAMA